MRLIKKNLFVLAISFSLLFVSSCYDDGSDLSSLNPKLGDESNLTAAALDNPVCSIANDDYDNSLIENANTNGWHWQVVEWADDLNKPKFQQDYYKHWYIATNGYWKTVYWYSWYLFGRKYDVYRYDWVPPVWAYRWEPFPFKSFVGFEKFPIYGWKNRPGGVAGINSYAPVQDWKSTDPNEPLLSSGFNSGNKIKWYWGGCTTVLGVLEDGPTKELFLVDGYVSKDAWGTTDFLASALGTAKVMIYANFIVNLINNEGFRIKGLVVSHAHADHVGDVPLLVYLIKILCPKQEAYPIITDYYTWKAANRPFNAWEHSSEDGFKFFDDLVTDVIIYKWPKKTAQPRCIGLPQCEEVVLYPGGVTESMVTDIINANENSDDVNNPQNLISSFGKWFTKDYDIYNLRTKRFSSDLLESGHLQLGRFSVNAYLLDHAYVPPFLMIPGASPLLRVNSFCIGNKDYGDKGKILMLDSTDDDTFIPTGEIISTDHIFMTWAPTSLTWVYDDWMGNNRERSLITARNHVRFFSNTSQMHYIVPMHVDDIMAWSYYTKPVCNLYTNLVPFLGEQMPDGLFKTVWIQSFAPESPFSMPCFMLHPKEFKKGPYLPVKTKMEYLGIAKGANIDLLRWSESRDFYYYAPQIKDSNNINDVPKVSFALFNKRLGLDLNNR